MDRERVSTLVTRLVGEAKGLVAAEVELGKARVAERVVPVKRAAIFFAAAGILALAALIALLVGSILTLATLIGPGLATIAVVVGVGLVAAILAMIGKQRLSGSRG